MGLDLFVLTLLCLAWGVSCWLYSISIGGNENEQRTKR